MAKRSYSGYYNGIYLRSSYEFVLAKILDHDEVDWKYEEEVYDIGFKKYKPDFFIYRNEELVKILEVKSGVEKEIKIAIREIEAMKRIYGIDVELVTYTELSSMCKKRDFKVTVLIREWIEKNSSVAVQLVGEKNPHFGLTHSKESKALIGESTKERWKLNREVYIEASKRGALRAKEVLSGKQKVSRTKTKCEHCSEEFEVIEGSSQRFCGTDCANRYKSPRGAEAQKTKAKETRDKIKDFILQWAIENKSIIESTSFNQITNLNPMFTLIESIYGVKDKRIISKAVFGEDRGRKELLKFLKGYVQD